MRVYVLQRINRDEQKCTSTYRWLESQLDLFGRLAKVFSMYMCARGTLVVVDVHMYVVIVMSGALRIYISVMTCAGKCLAEHER